MVLDASQVSSSPDFTLKPSTAMPGSQLAIKLAKKKGYIMAT